MRFGETVRLAPPFIRSPRHTVSRRRPPASGPRLVIEFDPSRVPSPFHHTHVINRGTTGGANSWTVNKSGAPSKPVRQRDVPVVRDLESRSTYRARLKLAEAFGRLSVLSEGEPPRVLAEPQARLTSNRSLART